MADISFKRTLTRFELSHLHENLEKIQNSLAGPKRGYSLDHCHMTMTHLRFVLSKIAGTEKIRAVAKEVDIRKPALRSIKFLIKEIAQLVKGV